MSLMGFLISAIAVAMPGLAVGTRVRRDSLHATEANLPSQQQSKLAMAAFLLSNERQRPSSAFGLHFARAAPALRAKLTKLATAMNADKLIDDNDADADTHADVDEGYDFVDDDSCKFFTAEKPSDDPLVACWLQEDDSSDDGLQYLCVPSVCLDDELDPEDSF